MLRYLGVVLGFLGAAGCAAEIDQPVAPTAAAPDSLIGGSVAVAGQFPSTVALPSCTASKVGDYQFLTAAHCVLSRSGLTGSYVAGATLRIQRGVSLGDQADTRDLVVARTMVHPRYLARVRNAPADEPEDRCKAEAIDLAIIEVETSSDDIPVATIDQETLTQGTDIIVGGYGCEMRPLTGPQPDGSFITSGEAQRLKLASTQVSYVREATFHFRNLDGFLDDQQLALCNGDSGGPVYRNDLPAGRAIAEHVFTRIVGTNACGGLGDSTMTRIDEGSPLGAGGCLRAALDRAWDEAAPESEGVPLLCAE